MGLTALVGMVLAVVIWKLWGEKMGRWMGSVHPSPPVAFGLYGALIGACGGALIGSQGKSGGGGFALFFGLCGAMIGAAYGSKNKWKS